MDKLEMPNKPVRAHRSSWFQLSIAVVVREKRHQICRPLHVSVHARRVAFNKIEKIQHILVSPSKQQDLRFLGKRLDRNEKKLSDYNIQRSSILTLKTITYYWRSGGGCFIAGTKVLIPGNKEINIDTITKGDVVMTYNMRMKKLLKTRQIKGKF